MSNPRNSSTPIQDSPPTLATVTAISAIRPAKIRRFPVSSRPDALAFDSDFSPTTALIRRPRWTPQKLPVAATMTPDRISFKKFESEFPVLADQTPASPARPHGVEFVAVDAELIRQCQENESVSASLCLSIQRERELETKLTRLDSRFRDEFNKWERDRTELEDQVETLRREKATLDAKLQGVERDRDHLKSYLSKLPPASEFEKLDFELKVKIRENERLMNSLQSFKAVNQQLSAKCDILTNDLAASRAQSEDIATQLAEEKSRAEELERRIAASASATGDDFATVLTENSNLKVE